MMADELFLRKENLLFLIIFGVNEDIQVRYGLNFKCDNGIYSAGDVMSIMNCKLFLVATRNRRREGNNQY